MHLFLGPGDIKATFGKGDFISKSVPQKIEVGPALSVGVGGEWGLGSLSFPPWDLHPLPAYSCPGVQAELAWVETMEMWVVWGEAGREATAVR